MWLVAVSRRRGLPSWRVKLRIRARPKAVAHINCGLVQWQLHAAGAGQAGGLSLVIEPGQRKFHTLIVVGSMAVARRRGWPGWRVKLGIRTRHAKGSCTHNTWDRLATSETERN